MKQLLRRCGKGLRLSRHPIWRRGLLHGVAATIEHESALRDLNLRTIIDVGANKGQFSLLARALFPSAVLHSFEPLAEPAHRFQSVFAGDEATTLHRVALGPESKVAQIHVSAKDDSSSLYPIAAMQDALFPGTAEVGTREITVCKLNDRLKADEILSPALLKIDVQGYELEALKGCEVLLAHIDWIYVECSFIELYEGQALASEVLAWIQARGFRLVGAYNMAYDKQGRAIQADFLFSRSR